MANYRQEVKRSRVAPATVIALLVLFIVSSIQIIVATGASGDSIQLSAILPKLETLHEETKALLIKNAELKNKILIGLQAQNEAKIKLVKSSRLLMSQQQQQQQSNGSNLSTATTANSPQSAAYNQINTTELPTTNTKNKTTAAAKNQQPTSKSSYAQQFNSKGPSSVKQQQRASTSNNNSSTDHPSSKSMIDFGELEDFNKWVEINLEYAVKNTQASAEALKEEALQNNGTVDYSAQAIKDGLEGVKYWQSAVMFQDKTLRNEKFIVELND